MFSVPGGEIHTLHLNVSVSKTRTDMDTHTYPPPHTLSVLSTPGIGTDNREENIRGIIQLEKLYSV